MIFGYFHFNRPIQRNIRSLYTKPKNPIQDSAGKYKQECEQRARKIALEYAPVVSPVSMEFKDKFLKCLYSEKHWRKRLPARIDYTNVLRRLNNLDEKGPAAPSLSWRLIK